MTDDRDLLHSIFRSVVEFVPVIKMCCEFLKLKTPIPLLPIRVLHHIRRVVTSNGLEAKAAHLSVTRVGCML